MSEHFADRLLDAIKQKGSPICVGLDPVFQRLPESLRAEAAADPVKAIESFCLGVLDVVAPLAAAVKPQIAHFERYRGEGIGLYFDIVRRARRLGLIVIGDVKRGDIGSTAESYAAGQLAGGEGPDAITVNGYFGADGLESFVETCRRDGKGIFVLVRTSNPSAAAIQDFEGADGRKFYEHMAEQVAEIGSGDGLIGEGGYSCVGAVVAATYPQEARRLREIMPRQVFLVPGYGAQGATARHCAAAFKADGTGAIVNASRSVIYAFTNKQYKAKDWKKSVESAAKDFAADIRKAIA
ncbi:MAG: orotidine-5'-phosphate decarboxylase [Planctomycetota bacterium]